MSKRHQASRRRAYGRRQHEVHERPDLRQQAGLDLWDERPEAADALDVVAFAERGVARFAYALAD